MTFNLPIYESLPNYTIEELYEKLKPITLTSGPESIFQNWAKTYKSQTTATFKPNNIEEVRLIIKLSLLTKKELRASGSGHSPSDLVCTNDFVINMDGLNKLLDVDQETSTVYAEGGIKLRNLHPLIAAQNLSMSSLGSISDQALAGAISTATHGSGETYGNLSTFVTFLDLILPLPGMPFKRVSLENDPDLFHSALCGLGIVGIIVGVGMKCEKTFKLEEECFSLKFEDFVERWEEIASSAEHVRCWWFPQVGEVKVSRLNRTTKPITPEPSALSTYITETFFAKHYHAVVLTLSRIFPNILPYHAQIMYALVHRPASIFTSRLVMGEWDFPTVKSPSTSSPTLPIEASVTNINTGSIDGNSSESDSDGERTRVGTPIPKDSPTLKPVEDLTFEESILAEVELARKKLLPPLPMLTTPTLRVDDSVKIFNYDCGFPQYTYEGSIPYSTTRACLLSLEAWQTKELNDPKGLRNHFPIEIRFTDKDNIWLSPTYGVRSAYIGIIQYRPFNLPVPYTSLFNTFESQLLSHEGRPHWAKSHSCTSEQLSTMYPKMKDFLAVRERVDPQGVLLNPYIRRHLLGQGGEEMEGKRFKASGRK